LKQRQQEGKFKILSRWLQKVIRKLEILLGKGEIWKVFHGDWQSFPK